MGENTKAPFWKPALFYGLIVGFAGIILTLVFYFVGVSTSTWVGWVSMVVSIALLAYCLIAYRNEHLGGYARFGQLFLMALAIGIVSSILGAVFTYILHTVIDPGLIDQIRIAAEEKIMSNSRIPESMYDDIFSRMEKRLTVNRMVVMALVWGPVLNAIVGLIVAAIVKKEEHPPVNA
ncbi:MAG: hypothetical protein CSA96_05350 [Bacteroidetes bacterium]|nr:MAG: hypothetical protein CSA96_05350 [Bacteroidota bacterium]